MTRAEEWRGSRGLGLRSQTSDFVVRPGRIFPAKDTKHAGS